MHVVDWILVDACGRLDLNLVIDILYSKRTSISIMISALYKITVK